MEIFEKELSSKIIQFIISDKTTKNHGLADKVFWEALPRNNVLDIKKMFLN